MRSRNGTNKNLEERESSHSESSFATDPSSWGFVTFRKLRLFISVPPCARVRLLGLRCTEVAGDMVILVIYATTCVSQRQTKTLVPFMTQRRMTRWFSVSASSRKTTCLKRDRGWKGKKRPFTAVYKWRLHMRQLGTSNEPRSQGFIHFLTSILFMKLNVWW